jgi:SsrA-binding protein
MAKNGKRKMLAANRSARHDYFFEEKFEAGIVLTGTEIKSLRQGRVNLKESYARIMDGEVMLLSMNISPYEQGNIYNVDPQRPRKLLLHRKEIRKLSVMVQQQGMTIVPVAIYINERGLAKLEIAAARGKKNYDKRESIAKRDADMKMRRLKMR